MLTLLTGKTGSGKSYHAVSCIMDSLLDDRKVFTNIKISVKDPNYVYLDELGIRDFLLYIETTFKEVKNLEDKKNEVKSTIYFESDFFIDEAHLVGFRDKKEAVLNWLTLQRHFNQNIHIITQVPTNVHRDYLTMFHSHIDMIPPNKRLSKTSMGLREYDAYKGDRLRTTYFKPELELFELYNSGNVEVGVNQVIFKLYGLGVGALILGVILYYSSSSFLGKYSDDENKTMISAAKVVADKHSLTEDLDLKIDINITRSYNTAWCETDLGCYYDGVQYSYSQFAMRVLPKFLHFESQTVLSRKDWKMIKYTLK